MGEEQKKVKKTTTVKKTKTAHASKKTTAKETTKTGSKRKTVKQKKTAIRFFQLEQPDVVIREKKDPKIMLEQPEIILI